MLRSPTSTRTWPKFAGHVAELGHDFAEAFEDGLDLILFALEKRRTSAAPAC